MRAILAAVMLSSGAAAAVDQATPGAFVVTERVSVRGSSDAVWRTLLEPARWWNAQHSWSGDAANLSIDPRPGGCFCERLPNGGGVEHLRVVFIQPGKQLRLSGGLGPLGAEAVSGIMAITLAAGPAGDTVVSLRYAVAGQISMGGKRMAPLVDRVLGEQLARLKIEVERAH